jgi:hypothetical protein
MAKNKINVPTHWDRADPIIAIAICSYELALDQAYAYDSLDHALMSYADNADDTAIEQGLPREICGQAGEAVFALHRHNKGN